jgi:5-methyltetrahydrofolate--homocysteine methyltransferase
MSEILSQISQAIITGDMATIGALTHEALENDFGAETVLNEGLMPGMDHVSVAFKAGDMFVPEVLRSARAMHVSMDILKPLLVASGAKMMGKVLLGTVKGDMHDIGKNLVGMMCEGAGFEVKDLGRDVAPEAFVAAVKAYQPDIVGMSALLTTTMRSMEHAIRALQEADLRDRVKIMIGGAPVTQSFAEQIGADGYASNAAGAAELAKSFVVGR